MARTQTRSDDSDDEQTETTIVTDGGNRRQPTDPAKALLEDAAGL
ncbi:MAG: hypothetical protein ABEI99_04570 [Halobaculum sp.]